LLLQEGKHNEGRNTLACRSSFSSLHFRTKPKQRGRNRSTYRSTPKHRAQQRVRIVIANLRWWFLSKATRLRSDVSPMFAPSFMPRALSCLDKATPLLTNWHLSRLMKSTAAASCWRAVLPRCWHRGTWEAHPTLRPFTPRANNLVAPSAPDPIIEEGWGKTTRVNKEHGCGYLCVHSWCRGENVHVRRELHRVESRCWRCKGSDKRRDADAMNPTEDSMRILWIRPEEPHDEQDADHEAEDLFGHRVTGSMDPRTKESSAQRGSSTLVPQALHVVAAAAAT
jgi:hypothetical protein